MKNKLVMILGIILIVILCIGGVLILNNQNTFNTSNDNNVNSNNELEQNNNENDTTSDIDSSQERGENVKVNIKVGNRTLTATLYDNATTRDLIQKLPLTIDMMDLYGREMCYRFEEELAYDDAKVRGYEVGEIIYYPPMHSFVFMYKQNGENFQMQSIGKFDSGIEIFETTGDTEVTIELAD